MLVRETGKLLAPTLEAYKVSVIAADLSTVLVGSICLAHPGTIVFWSPKNCGQEPCT